MNMDLSVFHINLVLSYLVSIFIISSDSQCYTAAPHNSVVN
jgi:hypothetical protein